MLSKVTNLLIFYKVTSIERNPLKNILNQLTYASSMALTGEDADYHVWMLFYNDLSHDCCYQKILNLILYISCLINQFHYGH
jgi:hypothetical protein